MKKDFVGLEDTTIKSVGDSFFMYSIAIVYQQGCCVAMHLKLCSLQFASVLMYILSKFWTCSNFYWFSVILFLSLQRLSPTVSLMKHRWSYLPSRTGGAREQMFLEYDTFATCSLRQWTSSYHRATLLWSVFPSPINSVSAGGLPGNTNNS